MHSDCQIEQLLSKYFKRDWQAFVLRLEGGKTAHTMGELPRRTENEDIVNRARHILKQAKDKLDKPEPFRRFNLEDKRARVKQLTMQRRGFENTIR
jgi:hypothetical protein